MSNFEEIAKKNAEKKKKLEEERKKNNQQVHRDYRLSSSINKPKKSKKENKE